MLSLRRYQEAAGLLGRILAGQPDLSQAWCLLAHAELRAGRQQEAALAADRAVALAPDDQWAHRIASLVYVQQDKFRAIRAAERACMLNPDQWRNQAGLAMAAVVNDRLADALRAAQTAQALAPDEPEAHMTAGQVSVARGDDKQAQAQFERVLALDPAHAGARNELGRIQLRHGQSGAAALHFLRAAKSAPGDLAIGRNVEIAVASAERRLRLFLHWMIYLSSVLVILLLLASPAAGHRILLLGVVQTGAGVAALAFWLQQLAKLPAEVRPLLRTGYLGAAFVLAFSPVAAAILLVVFGHLTTLVAILPFVVAAMFATRVLAYWILIKGTAKRRAQLARGTAVTG
jgi:tetratricopeptide (TPR) repeat protein